MDFELTEHAKLRISDRQISLNWIKMTLSAPQKVELDSKDPDLRHALLTITDYDNRVLRVIYNVKVIPNKVVSVYFDRKMRGKL
ncbi:DUF4258 domain-containing protein [Pseudanabaena sp. Chao 1811]|uniref:DUF4258 domain-containing protein n=1 Tax=Pseudanabaena sp. Chao 1811 TaxID=2963092 RepID=UPI0022F3F4C3|nr:DUF4258 domain-containing protein [Pseudanabaena sp. Chao 1811]